MIELNRVIQGDVYEALRSLPSDLFPVAIADPAYGTKLRGVDWDRVPGYGLPWLEQAYRVLAPGGICYVFGKPEIVADHWRLFPEPKRLLVWHYQNKVLPKLNFWQPSWDAIVCFSKGSPRFFRDAVREDYTDNYKRLVGKTRPPSPGRFGREPSVYEDHGGTLPRNVLISPALIGRYGAAERTEHPTQKPLAVITRLILSASLADEPILDLYSGSGTASVAASRLDRKWLAIERDPVYCEIIRARIAALGDGPADGEIRVDSNGSSKP